MTDWNNKEEVLEAVELDPKDLQHASEELRADKEVVMAAVGFYEFGEALQYASEELKADREVVLSAVKQDGFVIRFASEELRADQEIVIASFRPSDSQDGRALYYASEGLKADRKVVLAAVESDCTALQYASDALKADEDVVLAAVKWWGFQKFSDQDPPEVDDLPIQFADASLKTNREFLEEVVGLISESHAHGSVYDLVVTALETDFTNKEEVMAVIKENKDFFEYVPEYLKNDPEFMKDVEQYL